VISQQVEVIALYSTFAEDLETIACFFNLQDIKLFPRKTQ